MCVGGLLTVSNETTGNGKETHPSHSRYRGSGVCIYIHSPNTRQKKKKYSIVISY